MGYFVCYNRSMKRTKSYKKNSNSKQTVKFDNKSNVFYEIKEEFKFKGDDFINRVKFISDPKEPFFKQTIKEK